MKKISSPFLISFIYFIISFLWILFSDKAILLVTKNNEILTSMQTLKGWFFISITSVFLYFLIKKALNKEKDLKNYFKQSLDNLASPIIILREDGKVLTINKSFKNLTGYKYQDINTLDKLVDIILKKESIDIKEKLNSLYSVNFPSDNGIFYIKSKTGKILTWNIFSTPYKIKNNKKILILNGVDNTEIKQKEQLLIQQSKMAAMGEVLENIAHQWRQPLSNISTVSTTISLKAELNSLSNTEVEESMKLISDSTQYLSKTIDDFRSFFKPNKEKIYFKTEDVFNKTMLIIGDKFKSENINFIKDFEDLDILNDENALIQVFINIFNNSKDAFIENSIEKRVISIKAFKENNNLLINIKDNAGGINESIIHKIFEPYFTTKDKSLGTGIGLYMSEEIIVKHMNGKISAKNIKFNYENTCYKGVEFLISLPL